MSAVETGQMSAAETGQTSAVETRQMLKSQIRGQAQNHQNGPKSVENGRQVLRIGPNESHGCSGACGTGPAAKNPANMRKNRLFGISRWGHSLRTLTKLRRCQCQRPRLQTTSALMLFQRIRGWAENSMKWVENGRQDLRIGPNASYGRSGAFGTGPVAKNVGHKNL